MSGDALFAFQEKASIDDPKLGPDPKYFRAIGMIVPKNSGIQLIVKNYHLSMHLAKNLHWKFRHHAMAMVKAVEYGMASISSEQGAGIKSFNTIRQEQSFHSSNTGPKPEMWDKFLYGDKKFENQG